VFHEIWGFQRSGRLTHRPSSVSIVLNVAEWNRGNHPAYTGFLREEPVLGPRLVVCAGETAARPQVHAPYDLTMKSISVLRASLLVVSAFATAPAIAAPANGGLPSGILWPAERLADLRQAHEAKSDKMAAAIGELAADAAKALRSPIRDVTQKALTPPGGDKRDYLSFGPYWWPDPKKPDGLPYIRRDGEVNPASRDERSDSGRMGNMASNAETLALSWAVMRNEDHARRAALVLRTWFLDPETHMNPNLNFGQAIPGVCEGRGVGIIDSTSLIVIPDAVIQLRGAPGWSAEDEQGMREWFGKYLDWLLTSKHGKDEDRAENNHGTWYDVQCVVFARFSGRDEVASKILAAVPERRIARQIAADGSQPHELARTKSWNYSMMNLRAMMLLARLAETGGPDLWSYSTPDGRSIRAAIAYLARYADTDLEWPHQNIVKINRGGVKPMVLEASTHYPDATFPTSAKPDDGTRRTREWLRFGPL
jgi:hypothetical protein